MRYLGSPENRANYTCVHPGFFALMNIISRKKYPGSSSRELVFFMLQYMGDMSLADFAIIPFDRRFLKLTAVSLRNGAVC